MRPQTSSTGASRLPHSGHLQPAGTASQAFEKHCLRILTCTARARANSPGGLRFRGSSKKCLKPFSGKRKQLLYS